MREEDEEEPALPRQHASADLELFDDRVRQALSSTEWISGWAADAAAVEGSVADGRLSVAWIRVVEPSERLLDALRRLDRIHGRSGQMHLVLDSPMFAHPKVLHRWSITAMSVLGSLLGQEASFLACLILGELPRSAESGHAQDDRPHPTRS